MSPRVRDLMTPNPVSIQTSSNLIEAARAMRDYNIGALIVMEEGNFFGIVTDRDIIVRGIALGFEPQATPIGQVTSQFVVVASPDDNEDTALRLMQDEAVRRLPVMDNDQVIGIISIDDLAVATGREQPLGDISARQTQQE